MARVTIFCALIALAVGFPRVVSAAEDSPFRFALREGKTPDDSSWEKPAYFSFLRTDGGERSYSTAGTAALSVAPPSSTNEVSAGARVSWAKNTLKGQERDFREFAVQFKGDYRFGEQYLVASAAIGVERNILQSWDATTASFELVHSGYATKKVDTPVAFEILPRIGVFGKRIRNAPQDEATGANPNGTLRGDYIGASLNLLPLFLNRLGSPSEFLREGRWSLAATTQSLRLRRVVEGYSTGSYRLHTASLSYAFVDPPLHRRGEKAKKKVVPAISLSRQVGADPWNEVPRGGFTQILFTVRY